MLKRLAIHAIRTFEREVKEGLRPALAKEELLDVADAHDNAEEGNSDKTKRKKFSGTKSKVKQAKIVRRQERVDSVTGKARSRGYGFVETYTHADALRVLRWANNNPNLGPLFEQWWKEDLGHLLKLEKAKKQDDTRIKRIGEELQRDGTGKDRTRLIVEFSIENLQVVRRRSSKQSEKPSVCLIPSLCLQADICFRCSKIGQSCLFKQSRRAHHRKSVVSLKMSSQRILPRMNPPRKDSR
jgi:nucleolar protein 4